MVLEKIFHWLEKRPVYPLYLGFLFSLFGFPASFLLFREVAGLAAIFFTVMLALPSINMLLRFEEHIGAEGKEGFFREHENIFGIFLYFFIGVFIVFFIISLVDPSLVYNAGVIAGQQDSKVEQLQVAGDLPPPPIIGNNFAKKPLVNPNIGKVYSIILNNLYVMAVAFVLSLFYGAGSLFLIIFNSSVWASVLAQLIRVKAATAGILPKIIFSGCSLSVMSLYAVPEMAAYLFAAIGGLALSKAFLKSQVFHQCFTGGLMENLRLKRNRPEPEGSENAIKTKGIYAHKVLCSLSCPQSMTGGGCRGRSPSATKKICSIFCRRFLFYEGISSPSFCKSLKDALMLAAIAVLLTIIAGFIEVGVSEKLFASNACGTNQKLFILLGFILIIAVIILEFIRHRHKNSR